MADQVQRRGGTAAENDAFTGVAREVTVDTTNETLRVHDGATAGGTKMLGEKQLRLVDDLATLEALDAGAAEQVYLRGKTAARDGGQGVFLWDASDLSSEVTADPAQWEYIAPTSDATGASGAWVRQTYELARADRTVNVPSDYATLQAAIDAQSKFPVAQGVTITVNIDTGHALTAGFRVEHGDYSHITITSDDATVSLNAGFSLVANNDLNGAIPRSNKIGFLAVAARMPTLDTVIDLTGVNIVSGYELDWGSFGNITSNGGVINADNGSGSGANIRVTTGSHLTATSANFSGAFVGVAVTVNATADVESCNLSSSATTALDVSRASMVYANSANLSGSGKGIYARRAWVSAQSADFSNITGRPIWAALGSRVAAADSTFDGIGGVIMLEQGAMVDINGGTKSASPLASSDASIPYNRLTSSGFLTYGDFADADAAAVTKETTVTITVQNKQSVAATSFVTALSLSGEKRLYGGTIYGMDVGVRITVDGTVVLDDQGRASAEDQAGNDFSVVAIPFVSAQSSILVEAYNRATTTQNIAWKIHHD